MNYQFLVPTLLRGNAYVRVVVVGWAGFFAHALRSKAWAKKPAHPTKL